jgi:hypothetical protein
LAVRRFFTDQDFIATSDEIGGPSKHAITRPLFNFLEPIQGVEEEFLTTGHVQFDAVGHEQFDVHSSGMGCFGVDAVRLICSAGAMCKAILSLPH